jgi:uncharacterized protein YdeI (YjbR/CyaY-like superfamily)
MNFEQIEVRSRAEWRAWLVRYADQNTQSIWLVTFKKGKGPTVSYDDIVEEAICFGWIDSRVAKLDEDRSMLLLSPRRLNSSWSLVNKQRVEKLAALGLIAPRGLALIEAAKANGAWDRLNDVDALIEPQDLTLALVETVYAAQNWRLMPASSRRGILEWIAAAKRPETRADRVKRTAVLAGQGKKANFPEGRNTISGAIGPKVAN